MNFDTIVIGGGLAGLTAAIKLAGRSHKTAVVSTGQSTMHFNSGSLGLMGFDASHHPVEDFAAAIAALPTEHPYPKIGAADIPGLMSECRALLSDCGICMTGSDTANSHRITPLGIARPAWLTLDGMLTLEALEALPGKNVAIAGIAGFLDFYPRFLAAGLTRLGFTPSVFTIDTKLTSHLRRSESEMRAANIARSLTGDDLTEIAAAIDSAVGNSKPDAVIFPAVAGLADPADFERLRRLCSHKLLYCTTLGVSVPGMMMHNLLLRRFRALGGIFLTGESAVSAEYDGDRLISVTTRRLGDDPLRADNFIFAGGRLFSHGLQMRPDSLTEPNLGLDTTEPDGLRYDKDLFAPQPFMKAGLATDGDFHALRSGKAVTNLSVIGSALADANSLREGSGAGVAMLTAAHVAEQILK